MAPLTWVMDVHLGDPDAQYFASFMAPNVSGSEYGFVIYTVTQDGISARTNFSGQFYDSFQIANVGIIRSFQLFFSNRWVDIGTVVAVVLLADLVMVVVRRRRGPRPEVSTPIETEP